MRLNIKMKVTALCIACLSLSACSNAPIESTSVNGVVADSNVTAPGELPIVKRPIELTVGVMGSSRIENYETNTFTKYVEDKTGIKLKFYEFPSIGGYEKFNVMLSSGTELPEVIFGMGMTKAFFLKHAPENVFVDLTDYMDNYSYWFNEFKEKTKIENIDGWLSTADGKKYFMPHVIEQDGNLYGGKAFINKTWLDKLGFDMPETVDDFRNVMQAFKTKDPNGNGKADEICFTGSSDGWNEKPVNFLMNSFIYDDYGKGFMVDENYRISLNYTENEYRQGLKYISEMAKDNLVDMQCYTQKNEMLRALCSAPEEMVGAFASGSPDSLFPAGDERLCHYTALPPLRGPGGKAYAFKSDHHISSSGIITKYCKYPLAAYRLLDFMMSEEAALLSRYGVEGKDWKWAEEGMPALFQDIGYEAKIFSIMPYGATQNSNWFCLNPAFRSSAISDTMAWSGDPLDGEYFKAKALSAYWGKGLENTFTSEKMLLNMEEQEEYDTLEIEIRLYVSESKALFISGEKNLNTDWDSYLKTLDSLNITRYLELAQKGYDAFNSMGK